MADFGALFRGDDGSLLVTSDTPCYEMIGQFNPVSRSGNVNTYNVTSQAFPLIVVNCGVAGRAGVLAVEGGPGSWTVSVLSATSCPILAFVPISGNATSGYGMAAYDASGRLVFDSFRKILNARHISLLAEGISFQSTAGVDSVSYTSGPVRPASSASEQWVNVEAWAFADTQYICRYEMQYICQQQYVFVCRNEYVCTPTFSCSVDPFTGGFSCGFVDSCGFQQVCANELQTVCRFENVQICGFQTITSFAEINALIRTTNWTIERGVATLSATGAIGFDWLLHKSGYYKDVVRYETFSYSSTLDGRGLPPGYIPPPVFIQQNSAFEGELSKDNTFPYTSNRANTGPLTCITAIKADYD